MPAAWFNALLAAGIVGGVVAYSERLAHDAHWLQHGALGAAVVAVGWAALSILGDGVEAQAKECGRIREGVLRKQK